MKKIVINGRFMEDQMHGLVRYSRELIAAIDPQVENMNVEIAIPHTAHDIPQYKNIVVKTIGNNSHIKWEQTDLRKYLRENKDSICLNLSNVTPLFVQPGVTAILDIMYKVNSKNYTTLRNKISRLWHCFQYAYVARHEKRIITISMFCKKEIESYYPKARGKVEIIPCAWQHIRNYEESKDWKDKYPYLKDKKFYFSLATLSRHKNGKWIIEVAKKNPNAVFAIGGKHYETEYDEVPTNVHMLGYISDEDACALMKHCKAFIFPSIYEGFGLPPLEALALGTEVISSNAASLPEVLNDSVHYIDPYDFDIDLEELMAEKVGDRSNALNQFSWEKSAERLVELLRTIS